MESILGYNSISRSIFLLDLLRVHSTLWLHSHIYLTLDDGGSTPDPDPYPVLFISILFALLLHKVHIFFLLFKCTILIALNDDLVLILLCRHRDFFKDEIDMCSYSLLVVNSIFCCKVHSLNFFTCMPDICLVEILFIHFCR